MKVSECCTSIVTLIHMERLINYLERYLKSKRHSRISPFTVAIKSKLKSLAV